MSRSSASETPTLEYCRREGIEVLGKIPDDRAIAEGYARGEPASEEWARAYVETNALLADICVMLANELGQRGVRVAWEPPTHSFDPVRLVSAWSHKSIAAITGLRLQKEIP